MLLCASVLLGRAQNSLRSLEHLSVSGNDYVRLSGWCQANDFRLSGAKKGEELQAIGRGGKLSFAVDSRKAEVNGIGVLLSLPVVARNDMAFISSVDLVTTLDPLLHPPRLTAKSRIDVICLDPGHGGKDIGNPQGSQKEKNHTLLLAQEVAKILEQQKFKVVMTRNRDTFVDLSDRAEIANRNKADLFVSMHYNAAGDTSVKGLEVYCMSPAGMSSSNAGGGRTDVGNFPGNAHNSENMLLAYQMQKSILKAVPMEDRGVKRARFEVLRETKMPAVLIEGGFMSNSSEAKRIYDPAWRKRMAQAIADGILAYKKTVELSEDLAQATNRPVKQAKSREK